MRAHAFFHCVARGELDGASSALSSDSALARHSWGEAHDGEDWEDGVTPLHVATRHGHADLVALLLDHGADIEARTGAEHGFRTALHDSYEFGQEAITRLLLERGAYYDICVAAARGDFARVDELLAADPALVNDASCRLAPLGWAGYGQDPAMVPHLVARGAELGHEILCPCATGNVAILRAFLAAGADPDGLDPGSGGRPLHVAAAMRYANDTSEAVSLLLDAGADVNGRAADGVTTPLDVAAFQRDRVAAEDTSRRAGIRRVVELLVARGGERGRATS